MKKSLLVFALFLIVAAAAVRILRHFGFIHLPPNVAPIAALAMFGGATLPRRFALLATVGAMALSDLLIGFYTPGIMASVYLCFCFSVAIGLWLRDRRRVSTVFAGSLVGSVVFFLVTNAAVWLFGTFYPKTAAGLLGAYVAGIPFFRNTILGDLAFSGLLFGVFELAVLFSRTRRRASVPTS